MRKITEAQKQESKERKEKLRELAESIASMSEESKAAFFDSMPVLVTCEGHPLSPTNWLMAASQSESRLTMVGGFRQWLRMGRGVRKGEKAIYIFVPMKRGEKASGDEEEVRIGFKLQAVFDIAQTEIAENNEDCKNNTLQSHEACV